jgi:hypothetical protein
MAKNGIGSALKVLAGVALCAVVITGFVSGPDFFGAKKQDRAAEAALKNLVDSYKLRNEKITQEWTWLEGTKATILTDDLRTHLENGYKLLNGNNQEAFLQYDREEEKLFSALSRYSATKQHEPFRTALIPIEREVSEMRAKYTAAAGERNNAWAKVPTWIRSALGVVPTPHFRLELMRWKNAQEQSQSE